MKQKRGIGESPVEYALLSLHDFHWASGESERGDDQRTVDRWLTTDMTLIRDRESVIRKLRRGGLDTGCWIIDPGRSEAEIPLQSSICCFMRKDKFL